MTETASHSIIARLPGYRFSCNKDVRIGQRVLRVIMKPEEADGEVSIHLQTEGFFEITQIATIGGVCNITLKLVNSKIPPRGQISKGDLLFGHSGPAEGDPGRRWTFYLVKETGK